MGGADDLPPSDAESEFSESTATSSRSDSEEEQEQGPEAFLPPPTPGAGLFRSRSPSPLSVDGGGGDSPTRSSSPAHSTVSSGSGGQDQGQGHVSEDEEDEDDNQSSNGGGSPPPQLSPQHSDSDDNDDGDDEEDNNSENDKDNDNDNDNGSLMDEGEANDDNGNEGNNNDNDNDSLAEEEAEKDDNDVVEAMDQEEGEVDADVDSPAPSAPKRRRGGDDEFDDDVDFDEERLEDDDYDLLEENLGIKVQRTKYKRVRRIIDDDSDSDDENTGSGGRGRNERDKIADRLFEGGDDEESQSHLTQPRLMERRDREAYGSDEDSVVEEVDDFIVDDNNQPIGADGHRHRLRGVSYEDEIAVQEAQDVFGVDFDYDEMQTREAGSDDSMGEEEDYDEGEAGGGGRRRRRGLPSKPLKEAFEPAQLERFGLSETDDLIRQIDIPERFQTRPIPVTPAEKDELEEEAEWIFAHYFKAGHGHGFGGMPFDGDEAKLKENIATVLYYIRNENFEVPFIVQYKKDEIEPYLEDEESCWKVYDADSRFRSFIDKKTKLISMARRIQQYQGSLVVNHGEIPEGMQVLKDEYIEIMSDFRRTDQIADMNAHLRFVYSQEIQGIKDEKEKSKKKRQEDGTGAGGVEGAGSTVNGEEARSRPEAVDLAGSENEDDADPNEKKYKKSSSMSRYNLYKRLGLGSLVVDFGLPTDKLGESMRDGYQRFEIATSGRAPLQLAAEYKHIGNWSSDAFVLEIAKFMLATEISKEFLIRQTVRETFFRKAKLTVYPTPKGMKTIDENHPVFGLKFLKEKPVTEIGGDEFLRLKLAEDDKLIVLELGEKILGNEAPLVDELLEFCKDDAYSALTNLWNKERVEACRLGLEKFLIPELRKELRVKLLEDAKASVVQQAAEKFYKMTMEAPYRISHTGGEGFDWRGCRVLSLAYAEEPDFVTYAVVLGEHGNVLNYAKLKYVMQRFDDNKEANLRELGALLMTTMPHIVAISGNSRKARSLRYEVAEIVKNIQLQAIDQDFVVHFRSDVPINIFDPTLAKLYAASNEAKLEFADFPFGLKEAISLGRKLQDPLCEFAQMCNYDKDILLLQLHPLQKQISEDVLLTQLYIQMTRHVSAIGIDFNEIVFQQHKKKLLQFCPGLGPAKATGLIKQIGVRNQKLENRAQLIDRYKMGPIVFVNCAGHIKIVQQGLSDDAFTDPLDSTRIHPQQYDLATKIAVEACSNNNEEDDEDEDTILPQSAVEEVLKDPSKLDTLNMELFAEMLIAQGTKNARTNINICVAEYRNPFHDPRPDLHLLDREEEFFLLAQETPETFYMGKLLTATVIEIKRVRDESEIANSQPVRIHTDLFKCAVCLRDNFAMADAFNHVENPGCCPGRPVCIRLILENEIPGELGLINLSDKRVSDPTGLPNPEARVGIGQTIHVRIIEIDHGKFLVKCSSKTSDLTNPDLINRADKDAYYDTEREQNMVKTMKEDQQKLQKATQAYVRRLIVHPAFKNISYPESEKLMETMDQGEVVVRPSSKGSDHLTVTWKVSDGIYQHVDVLEQHKESAFTLGQKLLIGNEEYDDLDEIIARYINPMASNAREILNYKFCVPRFTKVEKGNVEEYLRDLQQKNNSKIHYVLYPVKEYPGKFLIAYLPRTNVHYEYITILEHGFKFRHLVFGSLEHTLKWFKEHYTEPPPPPMRPPTALPSYQGHIGLGFGRAPLQTPAAPRSVMSTFDECETRSVLAGGMARLAAAFPPNYTHMNAHTSATPYTPSGATPHMTITPLPSFLVPPARGAAAAFRSGAPSISGRSMVDHSPALARISNYNPVASVPAHARAHGGYSTTGPGNETLGLGFRQAAESWARSQQRSRVTPSVSSYTPLSSIGSVGDGDGDSTDLSGISIPGLDLSPGDPGPPEGVNGGQPYSTTPNLEDTSRRSTPATSYTPRSMTIDEESPYYSE